MNKDNENKELRTPEHDIKPDIEELTETFLSFMDELMSEKAKEDEELKKIISPIKSILPDFMAPYDAESAVTESGSLDEEDLALKFESGTVEETETVPEKQEDSYENLSENREMRIFYAALFLSGKPVELKTFMKMLKPLNLQNRLLTYAENFNKLRIGMRIRMVSGGFQVVTDSDVTEFLEKYFGERTESLSRAALETVAIIAYRQPVTKAEVEEMREVNSSGTMKYLLDKNIIKVIGRKQVPGKPLLYATTKYFLEYFGINDLSELPTFREWQELKQNQ